MRKHGDNHSPHKGESQHEVFWWEVIRGFSNIPHLIALRALGLSFMGGVICLLLTFSTPLFAAPPPCAGNSIHASAPYGKASLHKFFFHVYDAEFWTDDKGGWNMATPHALFLTYHVSIEKADLVERTLQELERNKAVTESMRAAYMHELPSLFTDVKEGESITALYQPDTGVTFCHNGIVTGVLKDMTLAKPFMGIWLGAFTSEPALRDGLLGKK
jgi:hypothetical protein